MDVDDDAKFGKYAIIMAIDSEDELIPIDEVQIYLNEKVKFDIVSITPTTLAAGDAGQIVHYHSWLMTGKRWPEAEPIIEKDPEQNVKYKMNLGVPDRVEEFWRKMDARWDTIYGSGDRR